MDTLLIKPKFDKTSFKEASMIEWEIRTLKNFKIVRGAFFIALIILLIGFITEAIGSSNSTFIIFIGILALIVVYTLAMSRRNLKRRYKFQIKEKIREIEREGITCTYEFSDDSVKYHDKEKDLNLKWSAFKGYSIYKEHIVFVLNNDPSSFFSFGKTETNAEIKFSEYDKILEFAKLKLHYLKIK